MRGSSLGGALALLLTLQSERACGVRIASEDLSEVALGANLGVEVHGMEYLLEQTPEKQQATNFLLFMKEGCMPETTYWDMAKSALNHFSGFSKGVGCIPFLGNITDMENELAEQEDVKACIRYAMVNQDVEVIPDFEFQGGFGVESHYSKTWGLERMGAKEAKHTGKGVHVYIFDTGIADHAAFGNRLKREGEYNKWSQRFFTCAALGGRASCAQDRHGHGTHVAGSAAGEGVGIAPEASVYAMKVLDDSGAGSLSGVILALDHLIVKQREASHPQTMVAGMSLAATGTSHGMSHAIDVALDSGILVVEAAGNDKTSACMRTPAHVPSAVTVGAIDWNDKIAVFSNWGECLDIFAPGVSIESCSNKGRNKFERMDGTSMAAPAVVGAAALLIEQYPNVKASEITGLLEINAIKGRVRGNLVGSMNSIAHVGNDAASQSGNEGCKNVKGFRDVKGFRCWRWRWNWFGRCNRGGLFHTGYTEAQLVEVKKNCPVSCGLCGARFGLPWR